MAEMKSLTLKGKYYEIVDAKARETIERHCAPVCTGTVDGLHNFSNDSAHKPLQGFKLFGKTTQKTTTGKNLLKITTTTHTFAGITYTINADGSVTANGTATDTSVCLLNQEFVFKAGVTYTLTGCPAGGGTSTYRIDDVNRFGDDGAGSTAMYDVDTTKQIRIRIANGTTVNNLVFWPMIRLASDTNPTFEPYTGGIPSPNPSYPQEIVGLENTTVKVLGENLLPYPYYFASEAGEAHVSNGGTFTNIGTGGIIMTGTPTGYSSAILTNTFLMDSDISMALLGTASNAVLEVNMYDENNNVIDGFAGVNSLVLHKADYPGKVQLNMSVKRAKDGVAISGTVYPMIVAGTTVPTEYKPYVASQSFDVTETLHGWTNRYPDTYPNSYVDDNNVDYISDYVEFGADGSGRKVSRFWVTTLTGDENITNYRTEDNTSTYFGFQVRVACPTVNMSHYQKCSHFTFGSATTTGYYPNVFMQHGDGNIYFRAEIEGVNSVATFKAWLAEQYAAGTPVTVVALRNAPAATPLTESEIEAFKQIYSNYPETTVINNTESWMETSYAADLARFVVNNVSNEHIANAVSDYLKEHPVSNTPASIGTVTLLTSKWVGSGNLYSQVVTVAGATKKSQVDLTPSVEQLVAFYEKDLTFVTENEDGVVTVYAIGQKPANDYTIQVTITEVNV